MTAEGDRRKSGNLRNINIKYNLNFLTSPKIISNSRWLAEKNNNNVRLGQRSFNPSHLNTSSTPGLPSRSRDRTGLISCLSIYFSFVFFSLIFLFVPCAGLSWLHVSFSLHVKYSIPYRIVS